jgi:hypothetical protein
MIIKVYRYQSGIQRLYIREGQIMQWEKKKEKRQAMIFKTLHRKLKIEHHDPH